MHPNLSLPIHGVIHVSTDSTGQGIRLIDGCQYVVSKDYFVGVAEGDISDHTPFFRLGFNSDVAATEEEVWGVGGSYVFPPSTGGKVSVVSGQNTDAAAGTGIRTVLINYLDTSYAEQSTTVTLNGTSTVDTVASDIMRVNSFRAVTAGSNGVAAGAISCHATSGATPIYRQIAVGYTRARSAIYTVPSGKTLYISDVSAGVGANQKTAARFALRGNYDSGLTTNPLSFFTPFWEQTIVDQGYHQHFPIPLKFAEKTDIKMSVYTNQSSGVLTQCAMRGWLE